jgi:hypothetical protein
MYTIWKYLVRDTSSSLNLRTAGWPRPETIQQISHMASLPPLKEQSHEMDIFWKFRHFNSTFCVCTDGFQGLFSSFSHPYTIVSFSFASLKLLTNSENAYWNPPQNSLLYDWPTPHWLQGKCARINLSQAASFMNCQCQNHRFRVFEGGWQKDYQNE